MKKSKPNLLFGRLVLFVFLFFCSTAFFVDPDFGWHIALGNNFLENGQVLRGDIFSWTMPGYIWGNSYVLYQAICVLLLGQFGYVFLVFLFGILGAIGFAILLKKITLVSALMTALAVVISRANFGVRPHVFSFLFFALILVGIERKLYTKPIFSLVIFAMFALWANIHRGFVVAILFFTLYLGMNFLSTRKVNKWAIICLASAILGTMITPFPMKIWSGGIADDFRTWENLYYIAEWFPTAVFAPVNILFAGSGIVLIYMFIFGGRRIDPIWFILAAILFSFGFIFVNLVSFWAAIFVFLVSRNTDTAFGAVANLGRYNMLLIKGVIGCCAFVVLASLFFKGERTYGLESLFDSGKYPVGALKYLSDEKISGNLLNEYRWGGYLLWQSDGLKVFIDGRMAGWKRDGVSILGDYVKIAQGNCEPMHKYDIEVLLVDSDFNTTCFENFREVWRDDISRVLVKT